MAGDVSNDKNGEIVALEPLLGVSERPAWGDEDFHRFLLPIYTNPQLGKTPISPDTVYAASWGTRVASPATGQQQSPFTMVDFLFAQRD
jgi:hypothetical protein